MNNGCKAFEHITNLVDHVQFIAITWSELNGKFSKTLQNELVKQ
jgi:hypothetical protein